MSIGAYGTIVADPPWTYSYSTRKTEVSGTGWRGGTENHYATMTMSEIRGLPVSELAAPDSVLWLWVVNPMLGRCLEVVDAWGFQYRGMLTWAKTARSGPVRPFFGMGYWLRGATEHAVLGVRGKPKPLRRDVPTWFAAPPGSHSTKPDEAMRIFESFSAGPRVELFARHPRPGWDQWGKEVASPIEWSVQ